MLFVGLLAALAGLAAFLEHGAPVTLDGWRHHLKWNQPDYGFGDWAIYYWNTWRGGNPRLGQWLTHAVYAPGPWGELCAAGLVVAFHLLIPALVLGRWPDPRRGSDLFLLVATSALYWMGVPQPGVSLFYRPVATNYTFGAFATLALFVPLRFWVARGCPDDRRWLPALAGAAAGFTVGLCNEHSGPTAIVAFAAVPSVLALRRGVRVPRWLTVTWVALVLGYLALYFAPGQSKRYAGLALEQGMLERVLERGWPDNPVLLAKFLKGEGWLLAVAAACGWVALVRRGSLADADRRHLVEAGWWTLGGFSIVVVTLVSPKIGSRMWIAGALPMIVATGIFVRLAATTRLVRKTLTVGALLVTVSCWGLAFTTYTQLADEFEVRMELIESAPAGSKLTVPPYSVRKGQMFFGDDFEQKRIRRIVAKGYGLKSISRARSRK